MQVERRLLGIAISRALDAIEHIGSNGGRVGPLAISATTRTDKGVPCAYARASVKLTTFGDVRADEASLVGTDAQAQLIAEPNQVRY